MASTHGSSAQSWPQQDLKCIALPKDSIIPGHKFASSEHDIGNMARDRMKHLYKDIELLNTDLPDKIFVRYAEDRPDFMKVLIAGSFGTPYAGGLFEFDLYCPLEYPRIPPRLTFCTTGGGSFRFNPNLYRDGKVCLSVIGTWQGSSWDANEGTILGILPILQACVLNEDPYCNEPGFEGYAGSKESLKYNRQLHGKTVKLAMLDWLMRKNYGLSSAPERRLPFSSEVAALQQTPKVGTSGRWDEKAKTCLQSNYGQSASKNIGPQHKIEEIEPAIPEIDQTNGEDEFEKDGIWDEVVRRHFIAHKDEILTTIQTWITDRAPTKKSVAKKRRISVPAYHPESSPNFVAKDSQVSEWTLKGDFSEAALKKAYYIQGKDAVGGNSGFKYYASKPYVSETPSTQPQDHQNTFFLDGEDMDVFGPISSDYHHAYAEGNDHSPLGYKPVSGAEAAAMSSDLSKPTPYGNAAEIANQQAQSPWAAAGHPHISLKAPSGFFGAAQKPVALADGSVPPPTPVDPHSLLKKSNSKAAIETAASMNPFFGKYPALPTFGNPITLKQLTMDGLGISPSSPVPYPVSPYGSAAVAPSLKRARPLRDVVVEQEGGIVDESLQGFVDELKKAVVALDDPKRLGTFMGYMNDFAHDDYDEDEDEEDGEEMVVETKGQAHAVLEAQTMLKVQVGVEVGNEFGFAHLEDDDDDDDVDSEDEDEDDEEEEEQEEETGDDDYEDGQGDSGEEL